MLGSLLAAALLLAAQTTPPPPPPPAAEPPPASDPTPVGPLKRTDPRVHDLRFEVMLTTEQKPGEPPNSYLSGNQRPSTIKGPVNLTPVHMGTPFALADAPIVFPIIVDGPWSQIALDSIVPHLWLNQRNEVPLREVWRLDDGYPYGTRAAIVPIAEFRGTTIRWAMEFRTQSFSSAFDDRAALSCTWPREWPAELAPALQPELYIESDHEVFQRIVQEVSGGRTRLIAPVSAAKEFVRFCVGRFAIEQDWELRGPVREINGLNVTGALRMALDGRGTKWDLVCVCVATVRAAGIPARPVIAITDDDDDRPGDDRTRFEGWAEFFLPNAGWVPFDPVEMKSRTYTNLNVQQPWPDFGTLRRLNRRVPIAFSFIPPRAVEVPFAPSGWGWDPRPNGAPGITPVIRIQMTGRGRGPG